MITGIDHVHVTTFDMGKSIEFYTNVLGFHFLRRVEFGPEDARRELAYVGLGDILLELLPPPAGRRQGRGHGAAAVGAHRDGRGRRHRRPGGEGCRGYKRSRGRGSRSSASPPS